MLEFLRNSVILTTNIFNNIIILYFFVANGSYTLLMILSFAHVWLYQLRITYAGLQEVRESPVTPPVTVIVPAFNEENSIILTVESLLKLDYPATEIIVVDDGSTDQTLHKLIEHFQLIRMDLIWRPRLAATPPTAFYHNPHIPPLVVVSKPNCQRRRCRPSRWRVCGAMVQQTGSVVNNVRYLRFVARMCR